MYPPHENRGGFHPFTVLFFYCLLVSGVNKTVPCSVSVPISSTLIDFTIVPDFNVQLSPIMLYRDHPAVKKNAESVAGIVCVCRTDCSGSDLVLGGTSVVLFEVPSSDNSGCL